MKWILVLLASALAVAAPPVAAPPEAGDVRQIQFESLLIQGQIQRPDIAIVTGDAGSEGDGLLRLRQDFTDLMAMDAGEAVIP